jgi:hypothetical protein
MQGNSAKEEAIDAIKLEKEGSSGVVKNSQGDTS